MQPLSVQFLWRWNRSASNVVWRVYKAQQENEKQMKGQQMERETEEEEKSQAQMCRSK